MRYKRNGFVGMHLREERQVIAYIIKAYTYPNLLSDQQQFLLDNALRIIANNQEFKVTTLNSLLDIFYFTLSLPPLDFQNDKNGKYQTSGWYDIPTKDRDAAAKRLSNRLLKRRRFIDDSWYEEFHESFDWELLQVKDKERAKGPVSTAA